ncbi:YHS domain-containing (seleno)protein [Methylopila sp. M107]|uniref:YHS domain-containing (seleno)protein n=1 Tax=Methylopila sp. M107 TaxID=1101190 RepID=UPI00037C47DA|nr:YHS domain-containing (seleno)protein [Methylopila sp. M107]
MTVRSFLAALTLAAGLAPTLCLATPGLNERIVADPSTGIALYGFDPVAYFVDGRPVPGRRDIEAEWNGAAWRFSSEANRAAFLSAPEVYAPRFGGYDPAGVSSGVAVAGHPLLFTVLGDRLYLFRTAADRDGFEGAAKAAAAWPKVLAGLTD